MTILGDYHTHTVFSHGKGTIEQNVLGAISRGLKEIAITDHGFRHVTFHVRRKDFKLMIAETQRLRQKYPQIKILLGMETNFSGSRGEVDLDEEDMEKLDIFLCGYHKFVRPARIVDYPRFYFPNFFFDTIRYTPKWQINRNTDTYIRALEKYDIDIITHMNYALRVDVLEVAKAARHFGTLIELNGKHINMTDDQICKMAEENTMFIINSDAHSVDRIGDFSKQLDVVKRIGLPVELIANADKIPKFRMATRREKAQ